MSDLVIVIRDDMDEKAKRRAIEDATDRGYSLVRIVDRPGGQLAHFDKAPDPDPA